MGFAQVQHRSWKRILITTVLVLLCLLMWAAYHNDIGGIQYTGWKTLNVIKPTSDFSRRFQEIPIQPDHEFVRNKESTQESILLIPEKLYPDKSVFEDQCKQSCPPDDVMCQPTTRGAWNALLTSDKVRYKPVVPPGTFAYPWEKEYLSFPPLKDSKRLPDLTLSTFTLSGENGGEVTCDVGQRLTGRIDLRDGYGNPRKFGLDEVRAWMVEANDAQKATAQVTDLGNGSYALGVTCLWPVSKSTLRVAVSYPREFLRSVIHQVNAGMSRYYSGLFKSQDVEEATVCHVTPNVPGRDCLCNFTEIQPFMKAVVNNYEKAHSVIHANSRGMYCGRPLDPRLNCSHWVSQNELGLPQPYNATPEEIKLIKEIPGPFIRRALKKEMTLITTNSGILTPIKSCRELSPDITWNTVSRPQGYWNNKHWESLMCKQPKFDKTTYTRCLRDATLYIYGDSNAFRLFGHFKDMTGSHRTIRGDWPNPGQAKNRHWNITVEFRKHDMVVRLSEGWRPRVYTDGSVESLIDAIPSTGPSFVIIHYFLHVMPYHLSMAQSRLQAAARGVSRLLQRNPEAYVAIRGPHVTSYELPSHHSLGGDPLGLKLVDIVDQAFSGMRDRVLFLDGWDMTIAMQNKDYHPSNTVLPAFAEKFLSFFCKSL